MRPWREGRPTFARTRRICYFCKKSGAVKIHIYITTLLAAIMAYTSCSQGGAPIDERIRSAEVAIDSGNYEDGQEICRALVGDSSSMTITQLCRVGVICATLADKDVDHESNMVLASQMLDLACARNVDSVQVYISSLPYELQAPVVTALTIPANPDERPASFPDEESAACDADSISNHSH